MSVHTFTHPDTAWPPPHRDRSFKIQKNTEKPEIFHFTPPKKKRRRKSSHSCLSLSDRHSRTVTSHNSSHIDMKHPKKQRQHSCSQNRGINEHPGVLHGQVQRLGEHMHLSLSLQGSRRWHEVPEAQSKSMPRDTHRARRTPGSHSRCKSRKTREQREYFGYNTEFLLSR